MATAVLIWLGGAFVATILGTHVVSLYMKKFAAALTAEHQRKLKVEQENQQTQAGQSVDSQRGFPDAGKLIGQLERFLIYLFITSANPAGVGFLVAAKSVFRFGELTSNHNRMEAEYITIGTLMSFSWGLAVSLVVKLLIDCALKTT